MPDKRREPRSFLVDPATFGTEPEFEPAAGDRLGEAAAAWYQSRVVAAILGALDERGSGIPELAVAVSRNSGHLRRKLSGEQPASLADLFAWSLAVGLDVVPDLPRTAADTIPHEYLTTLGEWRVGNFANPNVEPGSRRVSAEQWAAVEDTLNETCQAARHRITPGLYDAAVMRWEIANTLIATGTAARLVDGRRPDVDLTHPDLTVGVPPTNAVWIACIVGASTADDRTDWLLETFGALRSASESTIPTRHVAVVASRDSWADLGSALTSDGETPGRVTLTWETAGDIFETAGRPVPPWVTQGATFHFQTVGEPLDDADDPAVVILNATKAAYEFPGAR